MMDLKLFSAVCTAAVALFTAGCVHFDYSGSDAPYTGAQVAILQNAVQPPESQLLGKALVWGNYQDVSRERMLEKLEKEATDRGANVVRITAEQVVPMGTVVTINPMVQTMETVSPNNAYSMNELQKDFEGGYGQAELFGKNAPKASAASGHDYKRIIRAEFLLCKKPIKMVRKGRKTKAVKAAPAPKAQKQQKMKPASADLPAQNTRVPEKKAEVKKTAEKAPAKAQSR